MLDCYSDLAWSAVTEEIQPDSCKNYKSFLNLFTSNSGLCVKIIDGVLLMVINWWSKVEW